jgi:DNA-binding NarL/FixJ family response regulator
MSNQTDNAKRKVFIVDNHPLVREYLAALIQGEPDLEVCGDAADATAALPVISQLEPDVVILDISSKRSQGMDFLRQLKTQHPKIQVLALSLHDNRLDAERALQAGAMGYITKQEATVSILPAIRKVLEGQVFLSHQPRSQPLQPQFENDTSSTAKYG